MQSLSPQQLLDHYDHARPWPQPFGGTLQEGYEHQLAVREMRIARGEKPLGWKVGFTNRTIWPRYGVFAPIFGTVWDTTVTYCDGAGEVSLAGTCEPRLEPEAVFGIAATPPARASLDDLLACIDWVAPGFEVVHTHMPGWKFVAADTAADGALHGRLLIGRKVPAASIARNAAGFDRVLAQARVVICKGHEAKEEGTGANVLDGPLRALHHFLHALRDCPGAPDLVPGDVVTTGTWTDAWPVAPGETWTGRFTAPLSTLDIRFT